ncbi:MAG TPA: tyrosine--tRNA ligase [Candidatus Saccharimonadales bacterium]|nr:tyrosine--tRNA ligase [Candidatus Saccharimonadales bacterium]
MSLSEDLKWRRLIKDKTFASDSWLDTPRKFYLGIDASADSLTIGNLAVILLARRLAEAGWQAVLLAGGATSLVGDPGGKDEERELQPKEVIAKNVEGIRAQMERLFAGQKHELVNNLDWLSDVNYLDFLRDFGKHYPMTELMQREFVDSRMGQAGSGISYAEFSYSLLQGYDFWYLFSQKGVVMQIGASDQWGNILSGVSLIRKKDSKEAHALCMPLVVNRLTGKKFGKSEEGTIWLDAERTSPYKFYQFWLNTADEDTEEYLKVFTFLNKEEVLKLTKDLKANPSGRSAQKQLALEITGLVHGKEQAKRQEHIASVLFGGEELSKLDKNELTIVRQEIPSASVQPGTPTIDALVSTGLAASKSEARRLMHSGAVYVNGKAFNKEHLDSSDFTNGSLLLRRGKSFKDSALIELK